LRSSLDGESLLRFTKPNSRKLEVDEQKRLARLVVRYILENNPNFSLNPTDYIKRVKGLNELFPQEPVSLYYTQYENEADKKMRERFSSPLVFNTSPFRKKLCLHDFSVFYN